MTEPPGKKAAMEFTETIRRRRMVRNYQPLPVSAQAVERIVTAGLSAPSAGHSQGQSLVVVTDAPIRAQIARLAGEHRYSERGFDPWISGAPVHIVVCVSADAYHRRYREPDKGGADAWPVPYWWVDGGATLMAVLLAAVDEGLAAGFLGAHSIPGLSRLLGIPEDAAPLGVVTVGHAAPDRPSGSLARGRRPRSETVHYQRWGSGG
ncbi:MAG: nitroreductase family protein [bacterium]|nr:nitroreductase family protein [bacterium]